MGYITGQAIKSKSIDKNLEIIFIDDLYNELICIELNSHDGHRYKVKYNDVLEGQSYGRYGTIGMFNKLRNKETDF